MSRSAYKKENKKKSGLRILCLVLLLALAALAAFRLGKRPTEAPEESIPVPESTATPTEAPTPEPTAAPESTATPAPTEAPTPTPTPTAAPTAESTPEPAAVSDPYNLIPGGAGVYTYSAGEKEEWTLSLKENGLFTLTDPEGHHHTGEGWTLNEDGTVTCGPTDIYEAAFSFDGGCSRWGFLAGNRCLPLPRG